MLEVVAFTETDVIFSQNSSHFPQKLSSYLRNTMLFFSPEVFLEFANVFLRSLSSPSHHKVASWPSCSLYKLVATEPLLAIPGKHP